MTEEQTINCDLDDWADLVDMGCKNLLIGNGFSINVWEKFSYGSLYDVAQEDSSNSPLSRNSIGLFETLESTNFEDVLRVLFHAKIVDDQLGSSQEENISEIYKNTKNALASAVNFIHVPPNRIDTVKINQELKKYNNIFTTNYDVITYWAIMEDTSKFKDYFWSAGGYFNIADTGTPANTAKIYFLHGAIHLVTSSTGRTKKLMANGLNSVTELFDLNHPETFPLFISEGTSEWKLSKIKSNDYLRFCFDKLEKTQGSLAVLGHSLHKDYDHHLIDAINKSPCQRIAISVWPHLENSEILSFKLRLMQSLKDKELYFYNSETHPLGSVELNIVENIEQQVTCPVCNGHCKLGPIDCPTCHTMSTMKESEAEKIDLAEYSNFSCPYCHGRQDLTCAECNGSGNIAREVLLEK